MRPYRFRLLRVTELLGSSASSAALADPQSTAIAAAPASVSRLTGLFFMGFFRFVD